MGMYLSLSGVSDATIERLHADPPLVWRVVLPEDPDMERKARELPRPGFLARLFGQTAPPPPVLPPLELEPGEGGLRFDGDLDKAWHGIHFLLTGTAWEGDPPLNFLLAGGREIGDLEVGYAPARTYTAAETRAIAEAVSAIDDAELRRRFAPAEMMRLEIYPEIWDRDPAEDDTLSYLIENFGVLRGALARLTGKGYGLVVTLM